jgi:hypothetical protein
MGITIKVRKLITGRNIRGLGNFLFKTLKDIESHDNKKATTEKIRNIKAIKSNLLGLPTLK